MNIKLSGIVGKPETRYTPEGKAILTFSLGMYTGGNKDAGYKDRAWVRCEAWEKLAENNAVLEKGQTVTVTGQAKTPRKWIDNEGNQRPVMARAYALKDNNDDVVAIEKFVIRHDRVPERVFVWRGMLYIPVKEGEK